MSCFGEINVSPGNVQHMQGAVGFLLPVYLQIYQRNLPVKIFLKSVKIWQNYGRESVAPFLAHRVGQKMRVTGTARAPPPRFL